MKYFKSMLNEISIVQETHYYNMNKNIHVLHVFTT